jgi:hypothetical protein
MRNFRIKKACNLDLELTLITYFFYLTQIIIDKVEQEDYVIVNVGAGNVRPGSKKTDARLG